MALFDRERKALSDAAVALKDEIAELKAERAAREKALDLTKDVVGLKRQIVDLEVQKAKITGGWNDRAGAAIPCGMARCTTAGVIAPCSRRYA